MRITPFTAALSVSITPSIPKRASDPMPPDPSYSESSIMPSDLPEVIPEAPTFDGLVFGYTADLDRSESAICADPIFHTTYTPSLITSADTFQVGCCISGSSCSDGRPLPTECIPWSQMNIARFSGGYACTWSPETPYCNKYSFSNPNYQFYSCGTSSNYDRTEFLWPYQWSAMYDRNFVSTTTSERTSSSTEQPAVSEAAQTSVPLPDNDPNLAVIVGPSVIVGTIFSSVFLVLIWKFISRRRQAHNVNRRGLDKADHEQKPTVVHELPSRNIHVELEGTPVIEIANAASSTRSQSSLNTRAKQ